MAFDITTTELIADQIDDLRIHVDENGKIVVEKFGEGIPLFVNRVNPDRTDGNGNLEAVFELNELFTAAIVRENGTIEKLESNVIGLSWDQSSKSNWVLVDQFEMPVIRIYLDNGDVKVEPVDVSTRQLIGYHARFMEEDPKDPSELKALLPLSVSRAVVPGVLVYEKGGLLNRIIGDELFNIVVESMDKQAQFQVARLTAAISGFAALTNQDPEQIAKTLGMVSKADGSGYTVGVQLKNIPHGSDPRRIHGDRLYEVLAAGVAQFRDNLERLVTQDHPAFETR